VSVAEVSCGIPPVIQNTNPSAIRGTGTRYRDTVTYTCITGYEITSGFGSITCQFNKSWSTSPSCSSEFNIVLSQ